MVDYNHWCGRSASRVVVGAIVRGVTAPPQLFSVRTAFWAPGKPWSAAWDRKIARNRFFAAVVRFRKIVGHPEGHRSHLGLGLLESHPRFEPRGDAIPSAVPVARSRNGNACSSSRFNAVNAVVLTPIPSASVARATTVNPGFLASCRRAYFIRPLASLKILTNELKRRSQGRSVDCPRKILVPPDGDHLYLASPSGVITAVRLAQPIVRPLGPPLRAWVDNTWAIFAVRLPAPADLALLRGLRFNLLLTVSIWYLICGLFAPIKELNM